MTDTQLGNIAGSMKDLTHEKPVNSEGKSNPKKLIQPNEKYYVSGKAELNMKELIEGCLKNPGIITNPIAHESMPFGYTPHQNYLTAILLQDKKEVTYKTSRVAIITKNDAQMKPLTASLSSRPKEAENLVKFYEDEKEGGIKAFSAVRFSFAKGILPASFGTTISGAATGASTGSSNGTEEGEAVEAALSKSGVESLTDLKELLLNMEAHCSSEAQALQKEFNTMQSTNKKGEYATLLKNFTKLWDKYMRTALEQKVHFAPLEKMINEATKAFKFEDKPFPKFSIYRTLIEVFITRCYCTLENDLIKALCLLIDNVSINKVYYHALQVSTKIKSLPEKEFIDFFNNADVDLDSLSYSKMIGDMKHLARGAGAIIDMYVNEVNVHFIRVSTFFDNLCHTLELEVIKKSLTEVSKKVCKKINETPHMEEIKQELLMMLTNTYSHIFPPSFLTGVYEINNEQLRSVYSADLQTEYSKYTEDPKNANISFKDIPSDSLSPSLIKAIVQTLGLNDEDAEKFALYLKPPTVKEEAMDSEEFSFKPMSKEDLKKLAEQFAPHAEDEMADIETTDTKKAALYKKFAELDERNFDREYEESLKNTKNEHLGIVLNKEIDETYCMSGMTAAIRKKLVPGVSIFD